jgi:hypothetical protein
MGRLEGRVEDPVVAGEVLAVVRIDRFNLAGDACFEKLMQDVELRQEVGPEGLREEHPFLPRERDHLGGLCVVECLRLIDKDLLARGEGEEDVLVVHISGVAT